MSASRGQRGHVGRLRRLARRVAADEDGLSLIEIMIAGFVLAVAVLALASVATQSLTAVRASRDRQDATQLASTKLEEARGLPFGEVVLDTADNPPEGFDPTTATACDPASGPPCEEVVKNAGGALDHIVTGTPHTTTTYVSEVAGTDGDQRRVTVLASWGGTETSRTVRQETIIAEATRGLPVPSFAVSPQDASGVGLSRETICIEQTLTNLGEDDSYSWKLFGTNETSGDLEAGTYKIRSVNEPDGSGGTTTVTREGFEVKSTSEGAGWFGWARIASPPGSTLEPLEDVTGDQRPDTPMKVPALRQATFVFCYTPLDEDGNLVADSTNPTVTPRIYSAFDETVTTQSQDNELTNTLIVADEILYMKDGLALDRSEPTNTDATTDYDGDGIPGLALDPSTETTWESATADTLFDGAVDLDDPSVTLWVRGEDADGVDVTVDVRLYAGEDATPFTSTQEPISGLGTDWVKVTITPPLDSAEQLGENETLRLALLCDVDDSPDACHVHYDVTDFPSALSGNFS